VASWRNWSGGRGAAGATAQDAAVGRGAAHRRPPLSLAARRRVSDTSAVDDKPQVHLETRAAWREWLAANHASGGGVWLVTWKRRTGRPTIPYEEAVEEALCFGWIDGQMGKAEDERMFQWFAPRRPKSTWARSNKERVARLEASGQIAPAGLAAIERAKANGSWNALDDIDSMVVPPDLAAALAERPGATDNFEAAAPSSQRMALAWITQVKSPEIRARRVARAADQAASGKRLSGVFDRD
jgi:uncharacterized protein YdeI (YjbR/CyaY-like superfamily)